MATVTSRKSIDFPKLHWSIRKGEEKELPTDKKAQEAILSHGAVSALEEKPRKRKDD